MPTLMRLGATVAAGSMVLGGLSGCGGGAAGTASCADAIVHNGHSYLGSGDVLRHPRVTGRSMPAVLLGCDDSNAQAEEDESIQVDELADVPASTAVLFQGSIYVRDGRDLPKQNQR
jgi:hypothetical protein